MPRYQRCACGARTRGNACRECWRATLSQVVYATSFAAPDLAPVAKYSGEFVVCSDLHIPWHSPPALEHMCETAVALSVPTLVIAGDLIHADALSRFDHFQDTPPIALELRSARSVLDALENVFEHIIIIPGNHDQRIAKSLAQMRSSTKGDKALA